MKLARRGSFPDARIPAARLPARSAWLAGAAALFVVGWAGPASAERITIELNRIEDVPSGCRLSYVLTNGLPVAVDALTIEAVLFDPDGHVDRFLLLKARPLPVNKTRVQQFDVSQTTCAGIGRVLLNDVTECAGEGLGAAQCLGVIETHSRSHVPFVSTISPAAATAPAVDARTGGTDTGAATPDQ